MCPCHLLCTSAACCRGEVPAGEEQRTPTVCASPAGRRGKRTTALLRVGSVEMGLVVLSHIFIREAKQGEGFSCKSYSGKGGEQGTWIFWRLWCQLPGELPVIPRLSLQCWVIPPWVIWGFCRISCSILTPVLVSEIGHFVWHAAKSHALLAPGHGVYLIFPLQVPVRLTNAHFTLIYLHQYGKAVLVSLTLGYRDRTSIRSMVISMILD